MATLDVFRTTVGAAALGFARRALDEATRRAIERRLGEGRLADNPITQSKLAEMVLDVDASALLIYRAAWLRDVRSEEHTSELQSLMRISYAVFCLKKKKTRKY